jgi:hypothetical protein
MDVRRESEGCIAEKDYLYLLAHLEEFDAIPKDLYAVFEECDLPMAATLSFSQFVDWVRKYPAIMDVSIALVCCGGEKMPVLTTPCCAR